MGFLSDLFGSSSQKQPPKPKEVDVWGSNQPEDTAGAIGLGGAPLPDTHAEPEKVIPELQFTKVNVRQSADCEHLDVWGFIENTSAVEVEIMQTLFIKQKQMPGRFLKPGGAYELHLYAGPTPTNDSEVKGTVSYKAVRRGDYFEANYTIEYHCVKNTHGEHHIPQALDLMKPIREMTP